MNPLDEQVALLMIPTFSKPPFSMLLMLYQIVHKRGPVMIFTAIDTAAFFGISWMLDVCIYTSRNKALMISFVVLFILFIDGTSHALGSQV